MKTEATESVKVVLLDESGASVSFETFKAFKGTFSHSEEFIKLMSWNFWNCILEINPKFNPTEAQKKLLRALLLYAVKSDESTLDTNKGLYLSGSFGFGKSDILTALNNFFFKWWHYNLFLFQSATTCVSEYRHDQDLNYLTERKSNGKINPIVFCWDDLGLEPDKVNSFGNEINLFSALINIRYELWKQSGLKTHFTTNLLAKEFDERYTANNRSRIAQMCNIISVESESQREQFKNITVIK